MDASHNINYTPLLIGVNTLLTKALLDEYDKYHSRTDLETAADLIKDAYALLTPYQNGEIRAMPKLAGSTARVASEWVNEFNRRGNIEDLDLAKDFWFSLLPLFGEKSPFPDQVASQAEYASRAAKKILSAYWKGGFRQKGQPLF